MKRHLARLVSRPYESCLEPYFHMSACGVVTDPYASPSPVANVPEEVECEACQATPDYALTLRLVYGDPLVCEEDKA